MVSQSCATIPRRLAAALLLTAMLGSPLAGWAHEAANRIQAVNVDEAGNLVLTVSGEGFDPLLRTEEKPTGANKDQIFQIVLIGEDVVIDRAVQENVSGFRDALTRRIPAIEGVRFLQEQANGTPSVRVILESWQKLQGQVRSNTGNRIVIELVGNRQRPAHATNVNASIKVVEKPAESSPKPKPEPTKTSGGWMPGYRNITVESTKPLDEPAKESVGETIELTLPPESPPAAAIRITPKELSKDAIPPPPNIKDEENDARPTEPVRLKATPAGFSSETVYKAPSLNKSASEPLSTDNPGSSIYALLSAPQTDAIVRQAWQDALKGNTTGAELSLRNHLEKTPADTTARYLLAQLLMKPTLEDRHASPKTVADNQNRREAARQELLKIVTQKPFLPAYIALMGLYLEDENYEDAGRLGAKISGLYPNEPMVAYQQGRLHEALNELPAARDQYLKVLTKTPENVEAHYRLAQVELKTGRLDAARWELTQALATAPDDGRLWKLLGYIAERQNDPIRAAQYYQAALQPDAQINYGRLLESQNQPEKALAVYAAVENTAGNDADILYNLGMIYAGMKQTEKAEAALNRFLEINKDSQDGRVAKAKTTLKQLSGKTDRPNRPKILPF